MSRFNADAMGREFFQLVEAAKRAKQQNVSTFEKLVHHRYSCKRFDPKKEVEESVLRRVLELTQRAPSSFNAQPWVGVVVRSAEAKVLVAEAMEEENGARIRDAPVVLVMCADRHAARPEHAAKCGLEVEDLDRAAAVITSAVAASGGVDAWCLKALGIAAGYLMLSATAHGLETAPMEGFDPAQVAQALGLDADRYLPALAIALGHQAALHHCISDRKPLEEVFFLDDATKPYYNTLDDDAHADADPMRAFLH